MPKRFTETNKWGDPWFRKLPVEYKAFWSFLCDRCDNAGVWKRDIELASFYIGAQIDAQIAITHFNTGDKERVQLLKDDLWFLTDFISFQYGELSENCHPHKQVIELLDKYKNKGLAYPYLRVQDKDKDKDKEKEKGKDKDKDKGKEKNGEIKIFIDYAFDQFKLKTGEKLCVDGKKDGELVGKLLGTYGLEKLKGLWDAFLQSDDSFIRTAGYSIGVFKSQVNKLLSNTKPLPFSEKTAGNIQAGMRWLEKTGGLEDG